jgi:hypothetical protein
MAIKRMTMPTVKAAVNQQREQCRQWIKKASNGTRGTEGRETQVGGVQVDRRMEY